MRQRELPLDDPGEEAHPGPRGEDAAGDGTDLLERVLASGHRRRARHPVRRQQGAPGIEGMTGDALGESLQTPWPTSLAAWLEGPDAPQPVRRTAIPQAGGGSRTLGIPTVLDRFIEPALLQV